MIAGFNAKSLRAATPAALSSCAWTRARSASDDADNATHAADAVVARATRTKGMTMRC